jgi:PucR C-terminal helix-turn-helix domain
VTVIIRTVTWPADVTPRQVADVLRPYLTVAAEEMVREIIELIPEFARPDDDNYRRTVQLSVQRSLSTFLDVLDGRTGDADWLQMYRAVGAGEMREGRSLESLHAAMRTGARVAWRQLIDFAEQTELPTRVLGILAEATFQHLDAIAGAAAEGYAQEQAMVAGEVDRRRRRLLELMLADPPAAVEAVSVAAASARWRVPQSVCVVVLDEHSVATQPPPIFPPEVLVNLERHEPALIVPAPETEGARRALGQSLGRHRAAVGPPVPARGALMSMQWARQALTLARRGILHSGPIVWCRDHLGTLVLFRDERLLAELARQRLAPLAPIRPAQREQLAETLSAWLRLDRSAPEVAARLHVHPQTVRYRLRRLHQLFGDQLADTESRFELEVALRARALVDPPP